MPHSMTTTTTLTKKSILLHECMQEEAARRTYQQYYQYSQSFGMYPVFLQQLIHEPHTPQRGSNLRFPNLLIKVITLGSRRPCIHLRSPFFLFFQRTSKGDIRPGIGCNVVFPCTQLDSREFEYSYSESCLFEVVFLSYVPVVLSSYYRSISLRQTDYYKQPQLAP